MVELSRRRAEDADPRSVAPDSGAGLATIRVEYFTDPLCYWSWAFEPVWQQVCLRHGGRLARTIVLGGMIEGWDTFRDPMNDVGAPGQLAPLWHHAGTTAGVPIDPAVWHVDPPASSYPASVAVKAAALQGGEAGERYLALAREAVMTRRLNIAKGAVLLQLADELSVQMPAVFDATRFRTDLVGSDALEAFRADLRRARAGGIGRFPTLVVHGAGGSRIAVGYRPANVLEALLASVAAAPAGRESPTEGVTQ